VAGVEAASNDVALETELPPTPAVDNNMHSPRVDDEDEYDSSSDSGTDEHPTPPYEHQVGAT
jgi:hypothetical protein